jgi:hypothetical protein
MVNNNVRFPVGDSIKSHTGLYKNRMIHLHLTWIKGQEIEDENRSYERTNRIPCDIYNIYERIVI